MAKKRICPGCRVEMSAHSHEDLVGCFEWGGKARSRKGTRAVGGLCRIRRGHGESAYGRNRSEEAGRVAAGWW